MSATVTWSGLDELREALRHLPQALAQEAQTIVQAHAEAARRAVVAAYPVRTGRLKNGVTLTVQPSRFGGAAIVRSRAPHAHLFEYGTGQRRSRTGANRGRMPPAPLAQQMVPKVVTARRQMYAALLALVERQGLVVGPA
jgi:hypothetical protein